MSSLHLREKIQNGHDIHLKMNKKTNSFKNVNSTSFFNLAHWDALFMVFL